ncbi:MAG: PilZ domain-containing protein [Acidobacteriota bacterium]
MKERRKDPRINEENKIVLGPVADGRRRRSKKTCCCLTRDISMGGIRVVTDAPFEVGSRLDVELTLTRSKAIVRAVAQVREVKKLSGEDAYDMGLEFARISPADELALIEHIYGKRGSRS